MSKKQDEQWLADQARALHALSFLARVLLKERAQSDPATYQVGGGLEAENFLYAIEHRLPHPVLRMWTEGMGGHPGPSLRQIRLRRLAVVMSLALHATGLDKRPARKRVAEAMAHLFDDITHRSIGHWELEMQPPVQPEEQQLIETALERCRSQPEALIQHFLTYCVRSIELDLLAPA